MPGYRNQTKGCSGLAQSQANAGGIDRFPAFLVTVAMLVSRPRLRFITDDQTFWFDSRTFQSLPEGIHLALQKFDRLSLLAGHLDAQSLAIMQNFDPYRSQFGGIEPHDDFTLSLGSYPGRFKSHLLGKLMDSHGGNRVVICLGKG